VKKVSLFKKNILYYIGMGEDQNKSGEDRFEESLRQILDSSPSKSQGTAAETPRPHRAERQESAVWEAARKAEADEESKALFWFKLMRPLAMLALVALLAMFVFRVIER